MNVYMLIAVCLLSYGFGGLNGAYYLTGFFLKEDIRRHGSGNAGATNAGRVLGKKGFVLTVALDTVKTAAALAITFWITENNPTAMAFSALFLLIGHIFPLQLGFQGGKGIVVFLADSLFLVPLSFAVFALTMGVLYMTLKRYKIAGFLSMMTIPAAAYITGQPPEYWAVLSLMFFIVLLAHRKTTPKKFHNRPQ